MKHHQHPVSWLLLFISIAGLLFIAGCAAGRSSNSEPAIVDQAAAEATVIIQRAEATAMVLQAQVQATLLIQNANAPASAPDQTAFSPSPGFIQVPTTPQGSNATLQAATPETQAVEEPKVKLLGVSLGTESGLILVQFKAPPALARHWQLADLYIIDEATGAVYNEVPVMPVIGPLFARPNQAGQIGYVMLVNAPVPLQSGAQVTVNLGEYIFEHVPVK
ncbi:MAG: hypothetical protein A2Y88_10580 [Chloroflexi bacterium RBG_13_48_10]|nr:MAG: hypothetical protein A2Y88_10580 [Chloroflexi bacterium RBG_13_48_10]